MVKFILAARLLACVLVQSVNGEHDSCEDATCEVLPEIFSLLQKGYSLKQAFRSEDEDHFYEENNKTQNDIHLSERTSMHAHKAQDRSPRGKVDALYTWGAPGAGYFTDKGGARFPGIRAYNEDEWWGGKTVDFAAFVSTWSHAKTATLVSRKGTKSTYVPGPGQPAWPQSGKGIHSSLAQEATNSLHGMKTYRDRLRQLTGHGIDLKADVFKKSLLFAYVGDIMYSSTCPFIVAESDTFDGWGLDEMRALDSVGDWRVVQYSTVETPCLFVGCDKDYVVILQNKDYDCVLGFSGTNALQELYNSVDQRTGSYCGVASSLGVANEVSYIVQHAWADIKPKLSQCAHVTVVGHSLGGAMAETLAGCANSEKVGNADYDKLSWSKGPSARLNTFDCTACAKKGCVFPFYYNGYTYHTCTEHDSVGWPWCSTSADGSTGNGNFAYCNGCTAVR